MLKSILSILEDSASTFQSSQTTTAADSLALKI